MAFVSVLRYPAVAIQQFVLYPKEFRIIVLIVLSLLLKREKNLKTQIID